MFFALQYLYCIQSLVFAKKAMHSSLEFFGWFQNHYILKGKALKVNAKKSVIQSHMPSNKWWFFKQTLKCLYREIVYFAHYYQMSVQMKVVPKDREWQVVEIWYSPDCMFSSWNVLTQTDRSDQPKYSLLIE